MAAQRRQAREGEVWVDCTAARRLYDEARRTKPSLNKLLRDYGFGSGQLSRIRGMGQPEQKSAAKILGVNVAKFAEICGIPVDQLLVGGTGLDPPIDAESISSGATTRRSASGREPPAGRQSAPILEDHLIKIQNIIGVIQKANFSTSNLDSHIKKLAKMLHSRELESINSELTCNIDLEPFFEAGFATWPHDIKEELGLTILLIDRFAENPSDFARFCKKYFDLKRGWFENGVEHIANQLFIPFFRDYSDYIRSTKKGGELLNPAR